MSTSNHAWPTRHIIGLMIGMGLSLACASTPSRPDETSPPIESEPAVAAAPADLQALGCAGRFGVDPDALRSACGLGPLISHDELGSACELYYAGTDGQPDSVFTFREHRNRAPEQAWALHQASFAEGIDTGSFAEIEGSHWHRDQGYRWAYLPGWTHGRRVSWYEADCAPERMLPVLRSVVSAPQPEPAMPPRWQPLADAPALVESLSSRYGARDDLGLEALGERELPTLAKKIIVALLSAAARNDLATLRGLLGLNASFGLPDRREFDAWPVDNFGSIETFAANLDLVAGRFDAEASFSCPALRPQHIDAVTRGALPMWCFYQSADGLDLIVFRLRTTDGRGQVEYVGMFETQPTEQIKLGPSEPPPPPMTPDQLP
jgi:hypothetical protein